MFRTTKELADPRRDLDILAEIEAAVWHDDGLRTLERNSVWVEVRDGEVHLSGHVASPMHKRRIEDLALATPGVTTVHNSILADTELVTAVAGALAADPRTHHYLIPVGAFHGWIRLGGQVPNRATQAAVEEVAGRVPGVRGILDLPHPVSNGHPERKRRALQPRLGEAVYAEDGPVGQVADVVIDPRSRLVSHVVVNARFELDGRIVRGQFVVPVDTIDTATPSGVFLRDSVSQLAARPQFDAAEFPPAPEDWRPPFPYAPGTVRWPREAAVPAPAA